MKNSKANQAKKDHVTVEDVYRLVNRRSDKGSWNKVVEICRQNPDLFKLALSESITQDLLAREVGNILNELPFGMVEDLLDSVPWAVILLTKAFGLIPAWCKSLVNNASARTIKTMICASDSLTMHCRIVLFTEILLGGSSGIGVFFHNALQAEGMVSRLYHEEEELYPVRSPELNYAQALMKLFADLELAGVMIYPAKVLSEVKYNDLTFEVKEADRRISISRDSFRLKEYQVLPAIVPSDQNIYIFRAIEFFLECSFQSRAGCQYLKEIEAKRASLVADIKRIYADINENGVAHWVVGSGQIKLRPPIELRRAGFLLAKLYPEKVPVVKVYLEGKYDGRLEEKELTIDESGFFDGNESLPGTLLALNHQIVSWLYSLARPKQSIAGSPSKDKHKTVAKPYDTISGLPPGFHWPGYVRLSARCSGFASEYALIRADMMKMARPQDGYTFRMWPKGDRQKYLRGEIEDIPALIDATFDL